MLLCVLVGSPPNVASCSRVRVRHIIGESQRARILRLRIVGQAQAQPGQRRSAQGIVDAAVQLPEFGGAMLAKPISLELRNRERATDAAGPSRGPALPLVEVIVRPFAASPLHPDPLGEGTFRG